MDEDKKRILFIIGFVTLTLIFGYPLYSLFFAPDPSPYQPPTTEVTPQQEFPTAIEGQPIEGIPPTGLPTELPSAEITEADITAEKFAEQQQRIKQQTGYSMPAYVFGFVQDMMSPKKGINRRCDKMRV